MVFRRLGNTPNKLHVFQRQLRLQPIDLRSGKGRGNDHETAGGNQGHAAKHQYAGRFKMFYGWRDSVLAVRGRRGQRPFTRKRYDTTFVEFPDTKEQAGKQNAAKGGNGQLAKGKEPGGGNHHPGRNRQRDTDQRSAQYDGYYGIRDMGCGMHGSGFEIRVAGYEMHDSH